VFISIGQFVFDRYLMLHLPLMILVVLYLLDKRGAASSEQRADMRQAGKRASGQAVEQRSAGEMVSGQAVELSLQFKEHSEVIDKGRGMRDESQSTLTGWPASLLACFLLTLSFLFATIGVHDSFEWNRVRFGAIEQLEAQGITPHQIDGGAEYNSWQRTGPLQPLRLNEKSWWYVDGDEYAVAHEEIPGYERISAHPFTRYYGLKRDTLYVIKRQAGEQASR
jgi:hypothetical protein